jgi:hypothetical protein
VRLSVVNGEPAKPQETILKLSNYPVKHAFSITPGSYDQVRVRVQVFQMGPNPDDINVSGGLYVDTHVIGTTTPTTPIAYGSDVEIQVSD